MQDVQNISIEPKQENNYILSVHSSLFTPIYIFSMIGHNEIHRKISSSILNFNAVKLNLK